MTFICVYINSMGNFVDEDLVVASLSEQERHPWDIL